MSVGEGGASGEFFFSSFDNKLLIKTVPENEFKVFLKFLTDYIKYLKKNPNSLIARIYGIYRFNFKNADIPQIIILLENL